ncbi:MAG: ABC transporter permease [Planctomycetota bacterium]|nr:ABC transporter permease [Planctomycetota bacterium]
MRRAFAVFRRELGGFLDSPVAWVVMLVFVVGLHVAFFFLGFPIGDRRYPGFWAGRVASLQPLFAWLPLFLALLAPALTMGAWAEERRSGTEELLLTQPLRVREAVLGKFLAVWVFVSLLIAVAVLPVAVVVAQLGPLDWGTVAGGLLGAVLLAGACCAIGLFCSALSAEQLIAFLIAAGILLLLWSAGLFVRVLPPVLAEAAWYASPQVHYLDSVTRGVLDARDVVYYGLLVGLGLLLNTAAVEGRRWR